MKTTAVVGLIIALAGPAYAGQDPLGAAKDLYASAAYDEALSTLAQLADGAPPDVALQINQYRAFCLFALGRTMEAEQVAEALIRKDPLVRLTAGEVSPRIETMFSSVRKRVLPSVIRDEYRTARSLLDSKDLKGAEPHLVLVNRIITEVRDSGAMDETLSDLSLVVDGFLDLARTTAEQQAVARATPVAAAPAPASAVVATAAPSRRTAVATAPPSRRTGVATAAAPARAVKPAPAASAAARAPVSGAGAAVIYDGPGDSHLSPPVVVNQVLPEVPRTVADVMKRTSRKSLIIELVIDERGDVQNASIMAPVEPVFDRIVLRSARQWKYRPATIDGVPVKFRTSVAFEFQDQ